MTERIDVCEYLKGKTIKVALSEPRLLMLDGQDDEPYDPNLFNGVRLEFTDGSSVLLGVWSERDFEAWIVDEYSPAPTR